MDFSAATTTSLKFDKGDFFIFQTVFNFSKGPRTVPKIAKRPLFGTVVVPSVVVPAASTTTGATGP